MERVVVGHCRGGSGLAGGCGGIALVERDRGGGEGAEIGVSGCLPFVVDGVCDCVDHFDW